MRIKTLLLFLFLSSSTKLFAQNNMEFSVSELKVLGDSILKGKTDSVRSAACATFNTAFESLLSDSASFKYDFDSLKNVSILTSQDKSLKLFTWILPSVAGDKFDYFGCIQLYNKKTKKTIVQKLIAENLPAEDAEKQMLSCTNWFGALYYKVVENKINNEKIYTLLGWRGKNKQTTMKIIDVLKIKNDSPKFGAPVFKSDKGLKHRIIFEYSAQVVMSLKYDEKKKMIIFDHLSPSDPELKGKFENYGPDMTYDAFKFNKGKWNYLRKIEVGNSSEFDGKSQNSNVKHKEFYTPPK